MGAWIEIEAQTANADKWKVAPLVGAWIEIVSLVHLYTVSSSLLLWERGLKSSQSPGHTVQISSLLLWERGLKLFHFCDPAMMHQSLLLWERGLKLILSAACSRSSPSLLLRERGLKLTNGERPLASYVSSLLLWERGLKSQCREDHHTSSRGRSSCGSVD